MKSANEPDEVGFHREAISSICDGFILPKADFIAPQFSGIKTKTHLERWVLNCAKGTMFLSFGVLATPFDIVNIVKYRVISCIYRVFSCDIVNIVSIVA